MKEITIDGIEYLIIPKVNEELFNDWRLPTIRELHTLVNFEKYEPACDLEDCVSGRYWSSTPRVDGSGYSWAVNFYYGYEDNGYKNDRQYVRCVRDSKNGLEWSATAKDKMNWNEAIEYAKNLVAPVYHKDSKK